MPYRHHDIELGRLGISNEFGLHRNMYQCITLLTQYIYDKQLSRHILFHVPGRCIGQSPGTIVGMGSANERRRYFVTSSLIGWPHTQSDPWRQVLNFSPSNVASTCYLGLSKHTCQDSVLKKPFIVRGFFLKFHCQRHPGLANGLAS